MKFENVEQLAAEISNLPKGASDTIETRFDELRLWVSFNGFNYNLDWEAFSSIDGTRYDYGMAIYATALEAAESVARFW